MDRKQQHKRELLRRWLSGDITASEEAELRRAAREDELLGSAMAGYDEQASVDHQASIQRLRLRLSGSESTTVRMLAVWRVAAAVLLLGAVSWWLLAPALEKATAPTMVLDDTTLPNEGKEVVAEMEEEPAAGPTQPPIASTPQEEERIKREQEERMRRSEAASASQKRIAEAVTEEDRVPENTMRPATDDLLVLDADDVIETAESASGAPAEETLLLASEPREAVTAAPTPSSVPPPILKDAYDLPTQSQGYSGRFDDGIRALNSGVPIAQENFRIVEGMVKDNAGYPIIGATVIEVGTNNGTITDFDGFYRLTIPKGDTTALTVSYVGYGSQEVVIPARSDKVDIVLQEVRALLEKVAASVQAQETSGGNARPSGGFRALKRYIDESTPANTPRTRIRLQFTLQPNGSLTNFEVLSSSNRNLNDFAIELLQGGPEWEATAADPPLVVVYTVKLKG